MPDTKPQVHIIHGDYWLRVLVDGRCIHEHHTLESDFGLSKLIEALGAELTEQWVDNEWFDDHPVSLVFSVRKQQ